MVAIEEHRAWDQTERLDLDPETAELEWRRTRTRRRRPRVIHPAGTESEARSGRVTRALLWCGAVDEDLLETRLEYFRFANQGIFICLVAVLAGVSITLYLVTILGAFSPAYLVAAALWGTLIFFLDRSIVAEPSYGDLSRARQRRRQGRSGQEPTPPVPLGERIAESLGHGLARSTKLLAYAFRIVVAVLVAWLIGEAILLAILKPEITTQLDQIHNAKFRAATAAYVKPTRDQIATLTDQRQHDQQQIDDLNRAVNDAYHTWQNELLGHGGTGQAGNGTEAKDRQAHYEELYAALPAAVGNLNKIIDDIDAQLTAKNAEVAAIDSGDPARIATIPELKAAHDDIYGNRGWVEQEAALDQYLRVNGTSPTVSAVPWLIRGILLAIDLLPLMLKIASSSTLYGHRMRDRADRIRYRDLADDELAMDLVDQGTDLQRDRAHQRFDVARQYDQWRMGRWIGHRGADDTRRA